MYVRDGSLFNFMTRVGVAEKILFSHLKNLLFSLVQTTGRELTYTCVQVKMADNCLLPI